ncbi:M20/M25/M40 family metallo-hydrolase [Halieaceae bacterium IMCC14734]|uniref:M20/M25/M40 family metallo-hydrolase n=1 Tax=Candidatus Litorirhabdus singularis TaxID=2518993 RepID=A0ABT3TJY3_9GAMM|nr:M20/M25/M40 family metallo-hydrolase [Candidatus Litorirhabdus singularis]MCX2982630.1 M20/M25/M40 family metallo-hydrolase [Candidatus Litorirhabdus singularis]
MMRIPLLLALLLLPLASLQAGPAAENLAAAVRFATISHQDRNQVDEQAFLGLHAFLRETYPQTFAQLEVKVINDFSLVLVWRGSETTAKPVLFTAHMDVVPVEPGTEADWTHPAFDGVIENGVIYGRGTLDDKLGVISLLEAVERLLARSYAPARTVVFAFGHDEEVSGVQGAGEIARYLKEEGFYFDWMVDEGGMMFNDNPLVPGEQVALIGVAEKLYLTLIFRVEGEGGHSSRPPRVTTIGRLAAAVKKVEDNPFPARIVPPIDAMLERMAPHVDFPQSFLFNNLWLSDWLIARIMESNPTTAAFVQTTTALTMFNAGVKENVIPQMAEARINFRLLPGDSAEMVIERVTELVDDPAVKITRAANTARQAPVAQIDGPGFVQVSRAVEAVYPNTLVLPYMLPATTDVRHYLDLADNHYRFHGALIGMEQGAQIHGTDEQLSVASFEKTVDIAVQMIQMGTQP